ncbi:MAG: hypothetical protein QF593_10155, partial [Nitrospinota bacterium]|nr:hypothetical protein [Nitrospinota bacterium]
MTNRTIAWVCGLFLSLGLTPGCAEITPQAESPARPAGSVPDRRPLRQAQSEKNDAGGDLRASARDPAKLPDSKSRRSPDTPGTDYASFIRGYSADL